MKNALQKFTALAILAVATLFWVPTGAFAQSGQVSLASPYITFASVIKGATSSAGTVVLTNSGAGTLTVTTVAIPSTYTLNGTTVTNGNYADFAVSTTPSTNCGGSLAAAATCTISVTFTPTLIGEETASVVVTDNANGVSGSIQLVTLTGNGENSGPALGTPASALAAGWLLPALTGSGTTLGCLGCSTTHTQTYGNGAIAVLAATPAIQQIAAGSVTLDNSQNNCASPGFSACDILYWGSSTSLAITTSPATAFASGNAVLGFFTTNSSGVPQTFTSAELLTQSQTPSTAANLVGALSGPTTGTFSATTNQLVLGAAAHTDTVSFSAPAAANDTLTVPDPGATANFVTNPPPVTAVGATVSLTSANCGGLVQMGATTGEVVTLPAPIVGCSFDFVITVSNTSNSNEIRTDASPHFLLGAVAHAASGIAPLDFWADGSTIQAIKMDGAHLGGLIGSNFHVVGISSTQWEISGTNEGTSTMTTAFTASP